MDLLPSSSIIDSVEVWRKLTLLASGMARSPIVVQPLISRMLSSLPLRQHPASSISSRAVLTTALSTKTQEKKQCPPSQTILLAPPEVDNPQCGVNQLYTAMIAHAVAHLLYSPAAQNSTALKPMGIAVVSALEDARVERLLCQRLPGVRQWFEAAIAPPPLSDLTFMAFMTRLDRILLLPGISEDNFWVNKARDLFEATVIAHGLEDYAAFRSIASILSNDLGQMRVRMEPNSYAVPSRYRDDNSYLWQHPESENNTEEPISLPQSGMLLPPPDMAHFAASDDSRAKEMEISTFSYPEWDRRRERLKTDWCTVIDKSPAWQGLKTSFSGQFLTSHWIPMPLSRSKKLDRRQRHRRQWEGGDLDFNAVIEVLLDLRLGLRPDPRIYIRTGRRPRPISLLVLMDISESANDINAQGISLLDIEKQTALLLAQSNIKEIDRLAIHAFSSNTRTEVNYYRLLDFDQIFDTDTANLICALQGRYSTRLGAALRHANSLLATEPPGQRAVLVISDGAPSDIDVHDEQYLIEDARQAVLEASREGTRMRCLAVDNQADKYIHRIFGWNNYCIASDIQQLPIRLTQMSANLMAGR
ncbi:hypothetical protein DPB93_25350 [Salmonella enterica subsp. salamae]|nr:VWA domain-containing protein [Salmonella enterica subsp. salamae]ECI4078857.1 hypothetical protein [Salmonella enterica subsp. salamae]EEO2384017.1 VWA domain-containing protein [Salmonella enterica]